MPSSVEDALAGLWSGKQIRGAPIAERRLGHVWGMDEGTARDNSGTERSVMIWL
jgi:hypothetical protein